MTRGTSKKGPQQKKNTLTVGPGSGAKDSAVSAEDVVVYLVLQRYVLGAIGTIL